MYVRWMFFLALCFSRSGFAQSDLQRLAIGDTIPSLVLDHVLMKERDVARINGDNGRATILDFGSTYCAPCIGSLRKMNELHEKFGKDVDMIMVSKQKKEEWTTFLKRQPDLLSADVSIVTQDSILNTLFPHITEPHLVWIDGAGVIKAFTGHGYLTVENIEALLTGQKLPWPIKWDFPIVDSIPFVSWNPVNYNRLMKPERRELIYISDYMSGVLPGRRTSTDSVAEEIRYMAYNFPVLKMFCSLKGQSYGYNFFNSQIFLKDDVDKDMFFYRADSGIPIQEWLSQNSYCYEATFPLVKNEDDIKGLIWNRLSEYLGMDIRFVKKETRCLVMKKLFRSATGAKEEETETVHELFMRANNIYGGVILMDDLELSNKERAQLKFKKINISGDIYKLKTALLDIGIHAEIEERLMETLLVSCRENTR